MAWLSGWHKRVELTLDSAAVLTASLSNFPVAIRLSSSAGIGGDDLTPIFDDLGSDSLKIAVTTDDGETQCYVEVAEWDESSEIAVLWAKIPTISDSADTTIYLYFDSTQSDNTTYVGIVASTPGQAVWSENFVAVWHLNEDPTGGAGCIKDSLGTYDGTPKGTWSSGQLTDGPLDRALDFQSAHAISFGDSFDSYMAGSSAQFSHEFLFNADSAGTQLALFTKYNSASDDRGHYLRLGNGFSFNRAQFHYEDKLVDDRRTIGGSSTISTGTWYHLCSTYDATQGSGGDGVNRVGLYLNGAQESLSLLASSGGVQHIENNAAYAGVGAFLDTSGNIITGQFDGKIAEIRFSSGLRTVDWANATYKTCADDFITYGSIEIAGTTVSFSDCGELEIKAWDCYVHTSLTIHFETTPSLIFQAHDCSMHIQTLHVNTFDVASLEILAYDISASGIPIPAQVKVGDLAFSVLKPKYQLSGIRPSVTWVGGQKPISQWASLILNSQWSGKKPVGIFDTEGE